VIQVLSIGRAAAPAWHAMARAITASSWWPGAAARPPFVLAEVPQLMAQALALFSGREWALGDDQLLLLQQQHDPIGHQQF